MKKLLSLNLTILVTMLVSSLPASGYKTQTFEYGAWGDSIWGWQTTRCFNNYNDIHFTTNIVHTGNQSVMLPLIDTMPWWCGNWWLLYCKSYFLTNGICTDSVFMHDQFGYGSEVSYWFYLPTGAPIDSILVFNRDTDWAWCPFGKYLSTDLTFGAWNELIAPCSETLANGDTVNLPILQFDCWIYTDSNFPNPACTLYMDDVTSRDAKTGITPPEKGQVVLNIPDNSINCIEYSLSLSAHILIEIFNLSGQKVAVKVPGKQSEGSHRIYVDLPSGIYLVEITADKVKGFGKFISVK